MNGSVDLRLLSASIPDVDVAGHADINASIRGYDGPAEDHWAREAQ